MGATGESVIGVCGKGRYFGRRDKLVFSWRWSYRHLPFRR